MLLFSSFPFSPFNNTVLAASEDLENTYTEVDALNRFILSGDRCTVTNIKAEDDNCYVYYDFGTDNITNFIVDFTFETGNWGLANKGAQGVLAGFSNELGDVESVTAEQYILVWVGGSGDYPTYLFCANKKASGTTGPSLYPLSDSTVYYIRFSRTGNVLNCSVFTDSERTILYKYMSLSECDTTAWRYFYCAQTRDTDVYENSISYYTEDYNISTSNNSLPIIQTDSTSSVSYTSATLNGYLSFFGVNETNATVWFSYGIDDSYGTNTSYQDITTLGNVNAHISGLDMEETFYYRAVAQNLNGTTYGTDVTFTTLLLECDAPTDGSTSFTAPSTLDLTWTKDDNANNTIIVYRTERYPTSPSDGTVWYNGTASTYQNTSIVNQYHYIRAWSEANWSNPDYYNLSSDNLTFDYGGVTFNCYDENTSEAITEWGIFISNADHTQTYENMSASNGFFLNIYEFPYGINTIFVFNAIGYEDRIYYYDIMINQNVTINAYLPQDTELYQLIIQNEFSEPVNQVKMYIRRYINSTVGYENVSQLFSDSNGQVMVNLIPNELYSIRLNKTGWQDSIFDFIPSDQLFTYTFRITPEEVEYQNETPYHEVITFDGYKDGTTGYINFTDTSSDTINISIYVYEIDSATGNITAYYWYNTTAPEDIQTSFTLNTGNTYRCDLFLYHSVYGIVTDSFYLYHSKTKKTSTEEFEGMFTDVFGNNPLTWSGFLGIFVLLAGLFSFGQDNVGISLILTGFVMLGINALGITLLAVIICILVILFGIMVQWRRERRRS